MESFKRFIKELVGVLAICGTLMLHFSTSILDKLFLATVYVITRNKDVQSKTDED